MKPSFMLRYAGPLPRGMSPLRFRIGLVLSGMLVLLAWGTWCGAQERRMQFILDGSNTTPEEEQAADPSASPAVGQQAEAFAQTQPAEDEAPDIAALYRSAIDLYRAGKYAEAAEYFERILALDADYRNARNYLAEAKAQLQEAQQEDQRRAARSTLDQYLEQGKRAYAAKDYASARQAFEEVLALQADHAQARDYLSRIAKAETKEAEAAQAEQVDQLWTQVRDARRAGEYEKVIRLCDEILKIDPQHRGALSEKDRAQREIASRQREAEEARIDALMTQAAEAARQDDFEKAIDLYNQVLRDDPENRKAQSGLAKTREQARRSAQESRQARIDSLVDGARRASRAGDDARALQLYEQALEMDPDNRRARSGKESVEQDMARAAERARQQQVKQQIEQADALLAQDAYDQAVAAYEKALELDPQNRSAIRGIQRARDRQMKEARRAEEEAARTAQQQEEPRAAVRQREAPAPPPAEPSREEARQERRAREAAEREQQAAEQESRERQLEARVTAAQALLDAGDYEAAIAAANEVLAVEPNHAAAKKLVTAAQAGLDKREQAAREAARQAIAEELAQHLERARVYLEADQLDQAEAELVSLLEKDPEHKAAQDLMQRLVKRREAIAAEQERRAEQARLAEQAEREAQAKALFEEAKQQYVAGDVLAAVETWKKVLELKPDHAETVAYLEQTRAEYEEAVRLKQEQEAEAARQAEIEALLNKDVPLLDLRDTDIDNVLSLLGTISGFNIVAIAGVEGIITVNIRHKTVREALDLILTPNGFKYEIKGNDITVTTDFKTQIFPLSEVEYQKLEKILEDPTSLEDPTKELRRLIYGEVGIPTVPGKDLRLNPSTRSLVVTDTRENIDKVRAFLQDIPEFVKAKAPLESRHYKLDPESAKQVYQIIELQLYGEQGRRVLSADDPRLLVLEPETNILIVKDTIERLREVEAILNNQSLIERLKTQELIAKEFTISVEERPEGVSLLDWQWRRQQEVNFVVDILNQMLYGYEGQEEAIAKGRRIFRRSEQIGPEMEDGKITVVDTPENIKKVENYLSQAAGRGGAIIEAVHIMHADINALRDLLNRVSGRVRETGEGVQIDETIDRQTRLRISIQADPASQSIILRAQRQFEDQLQVIRDLIAMLDVPIPQVEIESRLVELRMDDNRGLTFSYDFFELFEDSLNTDAANRSTVLNLISDQAPGFNFTMATIGNSRFNFAMNAIEQLSNAEILSAPKVTVVSDAPAEINIITNEPYIESITIETQGTAGTADDLRIPTYGTEEVGITMTVTPTVLGDRTVIMDVNPSITTITGRLPVEVGAGAASSAELGQPVIAERSATTRVKVKDGDTLVLGGLIRDEVVRSVDKVPLLGDIPWLGTFFRDTSDSNVKSQLLIFMTVRVLPED